jgi:hypothetical protein
VPAPEPSLEGLNIEAAVAAGGSTAYRPVRVVEFSLRQVVFASTQTYRVRSSLSVRFTVSGPAGKPLVFTAQMVIRTATPDDGEVWLYAGPVRGIPGALRTELEAAAVVGRRKAQRFREFFQVTCTDPVFRALGTDISETGVGLAAPEDLPIGRVVELLLDLTPDDAGGAIQVKVVARAMHSAVREDGHFELGLEFVNLPLSTQGILRRYLKG